MSFSELTSIMTWRSAISCTPVLHRMMTVPVASRPLLPARPAIWMYSPRGGRALERVRRRGKGEEGSRTGEEERRREKEIGKEKRKK